MNFGGGFWPFFCKKGKGNEGTCLVNDPNKPYGDANIKPRVFMNCKGESYELIQVINASETLLYKQLLPLKSISLVELITIISSIKC